MTTALTLSAGLAPFDNVLVTRLLAEALSVLDDDRPAARLHIERAFVVAQGEAANRLDRGLLADWQIARVKQFVEKNIETRLRIRDAAARVKLSPSHFSRAFKASMGQTYSDFVTRHRITRAKQTLLLTEDPIAEIALACGFADQSHLTRLFRRTVGLPPGVWRRQQRFTEQIRQMPTLERQTAADGPLAVNG